MFDLNAAACFVEVARHESFSDAARRLGIPASTVSRKVQRLEEELGVRLLERTTRHVRVTDAGAALMRRAAGAFEELDRARLEVLDLGSELAGELRVSCPPNHVEVLTGIVLAFHAAYPRMRVSTMTSDRFVDMVRDGFDVAIRVGRSPEDLGGKDFVIRQLVRYRHVLCASPAYLEQHGAPASLSALTAHRCLGWSHSNRPLTWSLYDRSGERVVCHPNVVLQFNDYMAILRAACAGVGVGELPSLFCREQLERGELIELLPAWRFADSGLYAVQPASRLRRRAVDAFVQYCLEHLKTRHWGSLT